MSIPFLCFRLFFFHVDNRPGLGIDMNLHDLLFRRDDVDFQDQPVMLLSQLSFDDCTQHFLRRSLDRLLDRYSDRGCFSILFRSPKADSDTIMIPTTDIGTTSTNFPENPWAIHCSSQLG